jgi:thiol:disulfide interchange protein DsbD
LAYAKTVNKPIMLDFTGYACVNCRKMENNVWSDAMILPILNNEVVLISLYVDDKRDLPKSEQFISKTTLKLKQ